MLTILLFATLWVVTAGMSSRNLRARTCQGKGMLDMMVTDSLERHFVAKEDVEQWLDKEYRAYAGLPLDSVDLNRIEQIISRHSAVRDCQAWLTDDGILHVQLSQRQPVVRFDDGSNGYYADAEGFIFPLQSRGSVDVPVIRGHLPLAIPRGFKGSPEDPAQQAWLARMLALIQYMDGTVWADDIAGITVDAKGDLILTPREGKETFIFGEAVRIPQKFKLMAAYYQSVVPCKGKDYYTHVDLRFRDQLVCRK